MVVIHVTVQVKEGQADVFVNVNKEFLPIAREFVGCQQFHLYRDSWQRTAFAYYQTWTTEADFRAYQQSDAFAAHAAVIGAMLAGAPKSSYFTASEFE